MYRGDENQLETTATAHASQSTTSEHKHTATADY